jgi:hypothetical protein
VSRACNACNVVAPCCHRPLSQSSRAFCSTMTFDVTLPIFVHPRTFVKLLSVQGRSLDFRSLDFRSLDVCPWTFVHPGMSVHGLSFIEGCPSMDFCSSIDFRLTSVGLSLNCCPFVLRSIILRPAYYRLASYVLSSCILRSTVLPFRLTSVRHCSFPSTHHILQTVRCAKTL